MSMQNWWPQPERMDRSAMTPREVFNVNPQEEVVMSEHTIEVTDVDALHLRALLAGLAPDSGPNQSSLRHELNRARIVPAREIGRRVVTMQSRVLLEDADTHESMTYTLVQPELADFEAGRLSVLAPIGTAILGYREGDVVEWPVPAGVRRIRIRKVLYQPEADGRHEATA
jgi:regulator of nucleoside diphosphate kinase